MELVALILLFALFAGIAAIVQSPLIVGFGLGFWLLYKGMGEIESAIVGSYSSTPSPS